MAQRIIWTTLPNGIRRAPGGSWRAQLSLFVSPRLEPSGSAEPLSSFPAFLDWPRSLEGARFVLELQIEAGSLDPLPLQPVDRRPNLNRESRFWQALFAPDLPVRPIGDGTNEANGLIRAYDAAGLVAYIRELYRDFLLSIPPGKYRASDILRKHSVLERLKMPNLAEPVDGSKLRQAWRSAETTSTEGRFEQFINYHQRIAQGEVVQSAADEDLDFHAAVGSLGGYPDLLRKFGLAIDFETDAAPLLEAPPQGQVRIVAELASHAEPVPEPYIPWTAYGIRTLSRATEGGLASFQPRADPAAPDERPADGMLRLRSSDITVVQEQVDNAALSVLEFANRLQEDRAFAERRGEEPPSSVGPPVLQSAGMTVVDGGLARQIEAALQGRVRLETRMAMALAKSAKSKRARAAGTDDVLFAHQLTRGYRVDVLTVSDGVWRSLCQRRGSYSFTSPSANGGAAWKWEPQADDEGVASPVLAQEAAGPEPHYKSSNVLFRWDGWSLVVPRPGKSVEVQGVARSGDAGGTGPFGFAADFKVVPGSLPRQRFGQDYRFRARAVDLAGNSWSLDEADRLTARRDGARFVTAEQPCVRHEPVAPPLLVPRQPQGLGEKGDLMVIREYEGKRSEVGEWYVLPPRSAPDSAERHGLLDGLAPDESWRLIVEHEDRLPAGYDHDALRKLGTKGSQIRAPYLPDGMAGAAVLTGLPGADGPVGPISFMLAKPGAVKLRGDLARSFRIVVRNGDRPPALRGRVLTVYLPPGCRRTARLSASLDPNDVAKLALVRWATDPKFSPALARSRKTKLAEIQDKLVKAAAEGSADMLAPPRELTFIHAVQRPLKAPAFDAPEVERQLGSTTAILRDDGFMVEAATTARIDVTAEWEESIDDPAKSSWTRAQGQLQAFVLDIGETQNSPLVPARPGMPLNTRHAFPDTKYRRVAYVAKGISRFTDFYDVPGMGGEEAFSSVSKAVRVEVLNSAPPAPPEVAYMIPVFRREGAPELRKRRAERKHFGGGLRIYLKRPWFSSGDGERLAVVLYPDPMGEPPAALSRSFTEWGFDPLRRSAGLPSRPMLEDLRYADDFVASVPLLDGESEGSAIDVAVAAYDVGLDEDRNLLYCDIGLDPAQSYFPFVRLALARYQPNSLPGAALSPVVAAGFAQLTPDRSLVVKEEAKDTYAITVAGSGYDDSAAGGITSRVEVEVQEWREEIRVKDLSWTAIGDAPLELTAQKVGSASYVWTGQLGVVKRHARRVRLLVREYERFESDPPGDARADPKAPPVTSWRLVYADAVEIKP